MAKAKKGTKENPVGIEDMKEEDPRNFNFTELKLVDGFCLLSYDILKGPKKGGTIKEEKPGWGYHDDLKHAFANLDVHLAYVDDVYLRSNIEISNIDSFHDHELTDLYRVNKIKIKGSGKAERVELFGSKHVSIGGRQAIETPPVSMASAYLWYNEIKRDVENILAEAELYMNGKRDERDVEIFEENDLFNQEVDFDKAAV